MPQIRYLKIRFANAIRTHEIPRFRAAVIEKSKRQSDLFHNHLPEKGVLYRYPLIQYKITQRKASIVCLQEAINDIHYLLENPALDLRIGSRQENYTIEDIDLHNFEVQTSKQLQEYSLHNWQALSQKHHQRFQELEGDDKAQIDLLTSILRGHILAFAKGIDWFVEERIQLEITRIHHIKPMPFKGKRILAFSLNFRTNISLPNYIGLGKGSSIGFGILKQIAPVG